MSPLLIYSPNLFFVIYIIIGSDSAYFLDL